MQTIHGAFVWLLCGSLCVMGVCLMSMPGTRPPYLNELKLLKQFERLHRFLYKIKRHPDPTCLYPRKLKPRGLKVFYRAALDPDLPTAVFNEGAHGLA